MIYTGFGLFTNSCVDTMRTRASSDNMFTVAGIMLRKL